MGQPRVVDRVVLGLLSHPRLGLGRSTIGLEVRGRRSDTPHRFPVQYAEDDTALLACPAHSGRKTWWRNLLTPAPVSVLIDGRWRGATGEAVLPGDPRHVRLALTYGRRWPRVDVTAEPIVVLVLGPAGAPADGGDVAGTGQG